MTDSRSRSASTMRRDQRYQPHTTDSYRSPARVQGGTGCRECGAVYENGRWTWSANAEHTSQLVCPACRRILEHAPAGELWLESGAYLVAHHDEVVSLLRHESANEEKRHALERLMNIEEEAEGIRVTTTGPHTLRRLSEALVRAHHGHLSIEYRDGEGVLRARWSRQ
ncbi:BCAM0308 family protein [Paraburkholderia phymatum]|uniref:Glutamyl-tRNA amidotransferase n=1 Tax=Paraburkholderia phymatum (strain DSM 17167 / CIP 108236 / LMG 21445 / STM815) TaxID=391038 RepID=B2JTY7_PARP8|nr:BCAM0308 family protein [Paraburkholderia phymatum]ACC76040.1 conserved hypothetical protein [Paraburkholderia phymatum STM815]